MPRLDEGPGSPSAAAALLREGLAQLSYDTVVTFQGYSRVVLPLDGFVFWSPSIPVDVQGSLHYSQEIVQNEDETQGLASVLFTSETQVALFEDAPPNTIYVAKVGGFRFAFSAQRGFYQQSDIWHYFGQSIQPAMATQLLDDPANIDLGQPVVSNSLPLWFGLNGYISQFYDGFKNNGIPFYVAPPTLYPSFMLPPNIVAPYGAVHIGEDDTRAVQSVPLLDRNRSHSQLVAERVRITLYGFQNDAALDFQDTVNQYSVNSGYFGITNMPVIRDGIRTQAELQTRTMKKIIDYEISYNQYRVAQVARQLIKKCIPTYIFEGGAL